MASSGKKGKKPKGKTIALNDFLADSSAGGSTQTVIVTRKSGNWADDVDNDDDSYYSRKEKVVLPTAPRATRSPDVDDEKIPHSPPFLAYISNLPYEVNEEEIADFFHGLQIVHVRLPKDDRQAGKLKGFGYVEFGTRDSLASALNMGDTMIKQRRIRIEVADNTENDRRRGGRDRDRDREGPDRSSTDWRAGPRDDFSGPDPDRGGFDRRGGGGRRDFGSGGFRDGDRGFGGDRDRGFGGRDGDRGFGGRDGDRDRGFGGRDGDRDRGFGGRDGDRDRGFGGRDGDRDRGFGGRDGDRDRGFSSRDGDRDRGFSSRDGDRDRGFSSRDGDRDRGFGSRDGDRDRGFGSRDGDRDRGFGSRDGDRDRGFSSRDGDRDRGFGRDFGSRSGGFGPRRDYDRDGRGGREDYPPPRGDSVAEPKSRPRLNLQPRTRPVEEAVKLPPPAHAQSSIFGGAKPVDTAAREREIEERLAREKDSGARLPTRDLSRSDDSRVKRGSDPEDEGQEQRRSPGPEANAPSDGNGRVSSPHNSDAEHEHVNRSRDHSPVRKYQPPRDTKAGPHRQVEREEGRGERPSAPRGQPPSKSDDRSRPRENSEAKRDSASSAERMPKYREQEAPVFVGRNKFDFLADEDDDEGVGDSEQQ